MLVAAFLVLLSNSWVGLWRMVVEDYPQPVFHLIVRVPKQVEVYDSNWYPYQIIQVNLQEVDFEIRALLEGTGDHFIFKGVRTGNRLKGTLEWSGRVPQYPFEKKLDALRVITGPVPSPLRWIARHRQDDVIDVVESILRKASAKSFEEFLQFWIQNVEKEFYIFLERQLYGRHNDPEKGVTLVRKTFDMLEKLKKSAYLPAEKDKTDGVLTDSFGADSLGILRPKVAAIAATLKRVANADCLVIVPPPLARSEQEIRSLASIQNEPSSGREPCCGEKRYTTETFLITAVDD